MEDKKYENSFVNIGSSLLLVIFLVLCLVTFATLSLSSARSDKSFSQRLADRKTEYYQASNRAEELLARIDSLLNERDGKDIDPKLLSSIDASLRYDATDATISYQVPVNERQFLSVRLGLNQTGASPDAGYQILQWQIQSEQSDEEEPPLHLMEIP